MNSFVCNSITRHTQTTTIFSLHYIIFPFLSFPLIQIQKIKGRTSWKDKSKNKKMFICYYYFFIRQKSIICMHHLQSFLSSFISFLLFAVTIFLSFYFYLQYVYVELSLSLPLSVSYDTALLFTV